MDADLLGKTGESAPFLAELTRAAASLGILSPQERLGRERPMQELRRGRFREVEDPVGLISLTEKDGVLSWEEGFNPYFSGDGAMRKGIFSRRDRTILAQYKFEKLEPSQIGQFLAALDHQLNPNQGMREWINGTLRPFQKGERPKSSGRILLFIHGTFSKSEAFFDQFIPSDGQQIPEAKEFLSQIQSQYGQILAFDHPTLSVSPLLNAMDLANLFQGSEAKVDIVAHSRGGLVARWWLEGFAGAARTERVVLVGSPLAGTSLAAPPRLKSALNFLTNIGKALETGLSAASAAAPFLTVGVGLMKLCTSVTGLGARLPLVDGVVAMIPGLAGQSRVANNFELERLRNGIGATIPDYYAVTSNFVPEPLTWRFWEHFVHLKDSLAGLGADLIFQAENDLVVDTFSMTELRNELQIPAERICNFGQNSRVHHVNYFQQAASLAFLMKSLRRA